MNEIIRKLTSRKFLLAMVGVACGFAQVFGVDGSEIHEIIRLVGGVVVAAGSVVAYINGESRVDAAAAGASVIIEGDVTMEGITDGKGQ